MGHQDWMRLAADTVLVAHFGVVLFVVGGLVVIVVGNRAGWTWVNRWPLRAAHLAAIGYVAAQAWLGAECPLTTLESWLRREAGGSGYDESFIEHWLTRMMFYRAPTWVFAAVYTAFAALVVAVWRRYPPRRDAMREAPR